MPQASDADRNYYMQHYGFPDIGCEHGIKWLEKRGWVLTRDWEWIAPREPNEEELTIVDFLIGEWDFGGMKQEATDGAR